MSAQNRKMKLTPYYSSNVASYWSPETGTVRFEVGPDIDDVASLRTALKEAAMKAADIATSNSATQTSVQAEGTAWYWTRDTGVVDCSVEEFEAMVPDTQTTV